MATIKMPQLGESVVEGTIGKWLVQEGQRVERDQAVVEVLTDKADSEVPSPTTGVLVKTLAHEGDVVKVGEDLFEIEEGGAALASDKAADEPRPQPPRGAQAQGEAPRAGDGKQAEQAQETKDAEQAKETKDAEQAKETKDKEDRSSNGRAPGSTTSTIPPSSPAVRRLARQHGVDLSSLPGSGQAGRVTKDDVLRAVEQTKEQDNGGAAAAAPVVPEREPEPTPAPAEAERPAAREREVRPGAPGSAFKLPPYVARPGDEVVPFTRRRQIIADHMVYSKLTAPHVVTVAECDLHKTAKLRDAHKNELKREGINLTFLSFVAAATVRALREYRVMNSRVLEDAYVVLADINLGIAVDTEEGLIVPVIKHADDLTVRGLARAIDHLADKAREGNLTPDDLASKTFTISNPGRRGNLFGAAIISQPNVGILRTGEINKRAVVVEHDGEDLIAIRPVMHMALSYDHRVVDGVTANGFLYRITEMLEAGDFEV